MKKNIMNYKFYILMIFVILVLKSETINAQNKVSIYETIKPVYVSYGIDSALKHYKLLKEKDTDNYDFTELQLRKFGFDLLKEKKYQDAINVFELNTKRFPESFNALNDYARGLFLIEDYVNARVNYEKALKLNANNYIARFEIEKIYNVLNYEKKEFEIPMRDGVKLHTQVYIPRDKSKKYPFYINRTNYASLPYGVTPYQYKRKLGPTYGFSKEGFIFVYQNVRGRFLSEGDYIEMRPYIKNKKKNESDESSDIYDTIEWLLNNISNHNGKAGLTGFSYPGFYTLMGLIDPHPALAAVIPQAPIMDWFVGDDFHQNGAFFLLKSFDFFRRWGSANIQNITRTPSPIFSYNKEDLYNYFLDKGSAKNIGSYLLQDKVPFWQDLMKHGNYDQFWQDRNVSNHISRVKIPVLNVGGWFDADNLFGTLSSYKTIEKKNPINQNSIIIGPWFHGGWYSPTNSDYLGATDINVGLKKTVEDYISMEISFLNYYLKGEGNWVASKVKMYDIGINEWRLFDNWPPEDTEPKQLYFDENNALSYKNPKKKKSSSEYRSDPFNPVPAMGKTMTHFDPDYMICDQRFEEGREDVLIFKSDVLTENVTITGAILASLFVSTSGTDADWIVKVIDQFPEEVDEYNDDKEKRIDMKGYEMLLRYGVMRGKFRNSLEYPEPFVPNEVTKVNFALHDVCHTFKKGHRIVVYIQSSMFPIIDRNPQKFMDIYSANEQDYQTVINRLFHSKEYPSNLSFKILKTENIKQH